MPQHKHVFIPIGARPLYFFQTYYATVGWLRNKFPSDLAWFSRHHNAKFYYEGRDLGPQQNLWNYVFKHPDFFRLVHKDFQVRRRFLVSFFKKLNGKESTDKELFYAYTLWIQFYQDYQGEANAYARLVDWYGMGILRQELQKRRIKKIEDVLTVLTASSEESYLAVEERIFWQGVIRASGKKEIDAFLSRHLKQYAWVGRSYMEEPPLLMVDLQKRLLKVPKEKRKQRLEHLAHVLRENGRLREEYVQRYTLTPTIRHVADILRASAFLKDFIRGVIGEVYYYSDLFFDELEKRTHLHRFQIKSLTIGEFRGIFLQNQKPSLPLIEKRFHGAYCVYPIGQEVEVLYGRDAEKFEKRYLEETFSQEAGEFQGRPVSSGEATGMVRVVHTWEEMKTVKKGEILVVNNTSPAFVPYLHKVAAIIASEGGVTVHAALVSREMKIPCVIGIKDATRLFTTGERVKVDAEKGIVKRLHSKVK